MRLYNLDADPPLGISISTGIYTDPPQYTLYAKNYVQAGELNPFHDPRFIFFINSSVTPVAIAVFSLFGVSIWSSNLVGVLFSLGALLCFYFFVRRISSPGIALLFLILAGINYNLMVFGRFSFLEHAMALFAFLAILLATYFRNLPAHLLAGIALGTAIFFGKVIGLVFLFPFACYYLYRLIDDSERLPKLHWTRVVGFAGGLALVTVLWYVLSYQPFDEQVAGYLQEQSLSLYGSPEAFQSPDRFLHKFLSLGMDTKLTQRMILTGLAAIGFLGALFAGLTARSRPLKDRWFNAGHIFIGAMIIAFWGSLMIWNYRPLRYQLVMIYPVMAGASMLVGMLWNRHAPIPSEKVSLWFYVLAYPLVLIGLFQLAAGLTVWQGYAWTYATLRYPTLILGVVVLLLVGLTLHYKNVRHRLPTWILRAVASAIVIFSVGFGVYEYGDWTRRMAFTSRDISREIGTIVSPEAVLSGPYAPLLTLENRLPAIIHMFGVSRPDPDFFKRYPITHLLVDQHNQDRAAEDYPSVMDSAMQLVAYYVGAKRVRFYAVAGHTGNRMADAYPASLIEKAILATNQGRTKEAERLAAWYLREYKENSTGYVFMAEIARQQGQWDEAEYMLKKAVEFSPTSYVLNARLGQFYKERFEEFGNPADKETGLELFRRAMFLAPSATSVAEDYHDLEELQWQPKNDTTS